MSHFPYSRLGGRQHRQWVLPSRDDSLSADPTDPSPRHWHDIQLSDEFVVLTSSHANRKLFPNHDRSQGLLTPLPIASGTSPLLPAYPKEAIASTQLFDHNLKSWWLKNFSGWKIGITANAILATAVLFTNFILTIWALVKFSVDKDGLGTIYEGKCHRVRTMNLRLHVAISVLSTTLLSASNYCMQTLSAPTRAEVDRAHSKRAWLDIGLPSVRNLWRISGSRVAMWWCLALSSVPLQLMYNSAVFTTLGASEFNILVVAPEFMENGPFTTVNSPISYADIMEIRTNATNPHSNFRRVGKNDCIKEYGGEFLTAVGDLVVVTTLHDSTNSLYKSIPANTLIKEVPVLLSGEAKYYGDIAYCMSAQVEEKCKLQFSLYIMVIVILCNLVKSATMGLAVWKQRIPTLVTLGDAVSSFLETPDTFTEGMCLVTKSDISDHGWERAGPPKVYKPMRNFWFKSASWQMWAIYNVSCIGVIILAGILLRVGLENLEAPSDPFKIPYQATSRIKTLQDIAKIGLGAVTTSSLIKFPWMGRRGPGLLLANVFLASLPQGVLSVLYLAYNALFTRMLNAHEWSQFAHHRKPLRVTSPSGSQRATYYLQLPYRYSLPLLALSGTLQWLVSQSIFLTRITFYQRDGTEDPESSVSTCGYSCIGIISTIIVGSAAVLCATGMGFRRYPAGIPLAGGCSAVISAACHPPLNRDEDVTTLPLKWGVVSEGHCSISADPVDDPVPGKRYAGETRKRGTAARGLVGIS
ncbi:MAG: hypothetical protein M1839_004991 [Geoglossum umbratile]|nr:MAG: hypothetical protein M1839_004991 [Geoglossum umbratile]